MQIWRQENKQTCRMETVCDIQKHKASCANYWDQIYCVIGIIYIVLLGGTRVEPIHGRRRQGKSLQTPTCANICLVQIFVLCQNFVLWKYFGKYWSCANSLPSICQSVDKKMSLKKLTQNIRCFPNIDDKLKLTSRLSHVRRTMTNMAEYMV